MQEQRLTEEQQWLWERLDLAAVRLGEIALDEQEEAYFSQVAAYIVDRLRLFDVLVHAPQKVEAWQVEDWMEAHYAMFGEVADGYEDSFADPQFACQQLGEDFGRILSALYAKMLELPRLAATAVMGEGAWFDDKLEHIVVLAELFLEVYGLFHSETKPSYEDVRKALYWYESDYQELVINEAMAERFDPDNNGYVRWLETVDTADLRYLYRSGFYISDNEIETARLLQELSQDEIEAMAQTMVNGFVEGFRLAKKPLEKKSLVQLMYPIGFERMMQAAIRQFREYGLRPVISMATMEQLSTAVNKQFVYDHRRDHAIFLDQAFVDRSLAVRRAAYEKYQQAALEMAGPAVLEAFGEEAFPYVNKSCVYRLTEKQEQLETAKRAAESKMMWEYIPAEERSFTIIAYPTVAIGEQYREIFRETITLNNLNNEEYRQMQQHIIDVLDQGSYVEIKGRGDNQTDLRVSLQKLTDPQKQTLFENCTADVNIPVGEVFTSPQLAGTTGRLHVSHVDLNGMPYENLIVDFVDGMTTNCSITNFATEEENQAYLREKLLVNHPSLPLGEFAIGTNTTAYRMAHRYGIMERLPILIAEKMGPHFAIGDTCYSESEDLAVFNPDGKEIIARDNACSLLRKTESDKAYFHTHTDITLLYHELDSITVITADGRRLPVIADGRFAVAGCENLNAPLDGLFTSR